MPIEYTFGGLNTSAEKSKTPPGRHPWSLNCRTERGVAEARPGCGRVHPSSAAPATASMIGMGAGDWGGTEEIVWVLSDSAVNSGKGKLSTMNAATGTVTTYATAPWTDLHNSPWAFAQFENAIYALNSTSGLWKKTIGDTAETSWRRVNMRQVDIVDTDSNARLDLPSPDYVATNTWGAGAWAGTAWAYTHYTPSTSGAGLYATAPTVSVTAGKLRSEWSDDPSSASDIAVREFVLGYTFTTPINLINSRYWEVIVEVKAITAGNEGEWSANDNGEPRFALATGFRVYVSEDASSPENNINGTGWRTTRAYALAEATIPTPYGAGMVYRIRMTIDFDHVQFKNAGPNVIDSIKKIAFKMPVELANDFSLNIYPPKQGGVAMCKPGALDYMDGGSAESPSGWLQWLPNVKDIQYATTSYNSGTGEESSATFDFIDGESAIGKFSADVLLPLGSRGRIAYPAPAPGYDRVRIYRFRYSDGQFYLLTTIASGASGIYQDSLVDALDDVNPWPTTRVLPATHDFGFAFKDIAGASAITAWNGSLVIGAGNQAFLSYVGDPTKYLKPVAQTGTGSIDTENPLVGRTLYISNSLGDDVQKLLASEALYAVCRRATYAMLGPRPRDATPFFEVLPYGALGAQAACAMNGGVLVAARAGLYWVRTTAQGSAGTQVEYLTGEIEGSWAWLIGADTGAAVAVIHHDGEIQVSNGARTLTRTKTGAWEMGELPAVVTDTTGAAVNDAASYGTATAFASSVYGLPGYGPALPATTMEQVADTFALPEVTRI